MPEQDQNGAVPATPTGGDMAAPAINPQPAMNPPMPAAPEEPAA